MQRYRTTLLMVAILVVLGAVAFFLNGRNQATTGQATPVTTTSIFQEADPVVGIDVVSTTSKISLRKDISTTLWSITEPIQKEADAFALNDVSNSLQSLSASNVLTGSADLSQFGLDKPGLSITATYSNTAHTQHKILVGAPTFDGSGYYTRVDAGQSVYVVGNSILEPLRSWLTTPPILQPTPTPLPVTVVPTVPITGTTTITSTEPLTDTGTITSTAQPVPSPGASATIPLTATLPVTGTESITNTTTNPGSANATTPLAPTAAPGLSPTALP